MSRKKKNREYAIVDIETTGGNASGSRITEIAILIHNGYIARGTKVLKNLPIRKIDFSDAKQKTLHDKIVETQQELISIYDQIDANAGNKRALTPLQGQFVREKANLEKLRVTGRR